MEVLVCLTCPVWYLLAPCGKIGRNLGDYDERTSWGEACAPTGPSPFLKCCTYHVFCCNLHGDCGSNDYVCGRTHCGCCGTTCCGR